MRSPSRLIEVLRSVNTDVVGWEIGALFGLVADKLSEGVRLSIRQRNLMKKLVVHQSPHIGELASEALHLDAN